MTYPVQTEPTDLEQARKARRAGWKVDYPKEPRCVRGEHRYVTGRKTCPDCGEDY
jgi:hypothetical protein